MITFEPNGHSTYHCHTHWSDGANSPAEMVAAAQRIGFREIGISDHLVLHPQRLPVSWSMDPSRLDDYAGEVHEAASGAEIPVKLGLEIDFFPENPRQAELAEMLARHPFDYVVASVHMIDSFPLDSNASDWAALSESEIDALHIRYWQNIKQLAQLPRGVMIAHLDLPKKFGYRATVDVSGLQSQALDAIAGSRKMIELNTAGWDKPCAECYPSPRLLQQCILREIPVVLNDDAHASEQLGRHYEQALALLKSMKE